ncbi:MAG: UvrD-helicase domain-containing protein [Syntrophales bacterium]|nr:UvrD-helicase domain-containing protein [Syntrophales bacterium]
MRKTEDEKYRKMIVKDIDVSMLVEAGAGSGKTSSLVNRMLALIAEGKCTVGRMAAVTFTRKAAAELKGRFQMALEEALKKEKDRLKRDNYDRALSRLDLLFTGTIHSFCARLLRERPIEARLDPDFEELEEDETLILRDQCWSEYLQMLHTGETPVLKQIESIGLNPSDLINAYQAAAQYPEVEIIREKLERPDFGKEKRLLMDYLDRAINALPATVPEKGWDDLQTILRKAVLRRRNLNIEKDVDFIKMLSGLDKSGRVTQKKWSTSDIAKEQKAAFDRFRTDIVVPCLKKWRSYCHYFVMELVEPAIDYFKRHREKNSILNFNDLLLKAATLLRNNPEVREYFRERFSHILVDEFQDTDPIQAEVILYLTGDNLNETSWRRLKVRPGALFIVGDPKQSIYRFRRADIDTYNEVKSVIKDSGGRIIPLTTNFRSLPSICDWLNPIFKGKFPDKANQHQPAFESLNSFEKVNDGGVRRITIPSVARNKQEEIAWLDAERIASWIDQALKEKDYDGPGDFMILLRYKKHLPVYASALEARGIPYEITGGTGFNESEELRQVLNLLQAIAEPEDQVALIAAMRGAFFGISDDLLYRFYKGGGCFSYLVPQEQCEDEEARNRIEPIFGKFLQFYRWTRTTPPATALTMILDHLGIIPLAVTKDMGDSRAGNLLKALELTMWESARAPTSFAALVERLGKYYKELDIEALTIEPGKKDAVRIMNLHKAKGLEATVVFLADPLRESSHEPETHISRKEDTPVGYFMASCKKGEYKYETIGLPPDWETYQEIEQKYQQAEEDRLLYVAATRAKRLLVISTYPGKPGKGAWTDFYTYLEEVKELETYAEEEAIIDKGQIASEEFEAGIKETAEKIARSKIFTYYTETVTAMVEASSGEMPFSEDTGRGMSWGRIIHRMLETAAKDETVDLGILAENLLKEEGRPLSEKDSAVATVNAVISSDLWGRMKKADTALFETPFSFKRKEGEAPKIVSGVIDLIFKEKKGWIIADYKTDRVDGNLDALTRYYRPQIEMYRKFWKEMTEEDVSEAGLYFIDAGKWVTI